MILTFIILFCIFIGEIGGGNCPLNGFALCPSHLLSNALLNNVIMSKRREFTTDDKFNSLTFVKELDPLIRRAKYGKDGIGHERVMLWRCDCGNEKAIRMSSVINGVTKTCGCLHTEVCRKLLTTHGMYNHPLRVVHRNMISRCYNKKYKDYHRWGGRGIIVCEEWLNSLPKFIEWSESNGYAKGLTLDRIDNDGNYEPENCRFADRVVQANNRRSNRTVIINECNITLEQFCKTYNLNRKTASKKLNEGKAPSDVINEMREYHKKHIRKVLSAK